MANISKMSGFINRNHIKNALAAPENFALPRLRENDGEGLARPGG
jgi:hypothetical protein